MFHAFKEKGDITMHKIQSLETLISKVDAFIRMYYKNRIIRGLIYSGALLFVFFLFVNLLEYFSYFGSTARTVMFFGYILGAFAIIGFYIFVPLLKLYRIGKRISYNQAAGIISRHFPEVSDKLINTLQLGEMIDPGSGNIEILEAAITQKTEKIRHIPFTEAIDKKENVRKMPYALVPLLIILILLVAAPTVIKEPAHRITNYRVHYERPMPFGFIVDRNELSVLRGDDLDLSIKVTGSELPAEVLVEYQQKTARTVKRSNNEFIYRFRNLNTDFTFRLQGGGFYSEPYKVTVLPKPVILNYTVKLDYPAYTRKAGVELANTGDLTVPEGTDITWLFNTTSVDSVIIRTGLRTGPRIERLSKDRFQAKMRTLESFDYTIIPVNKYTVARDSIMHQIGVVPDMYPEIQVETFIDSSNFRMAYFSGQIKDDYGFDKLEFHYKRKNVRSLDKIIEEENRLIQIDKTLNNQSFFYNIDFSETTIEPGDRIEYWFQVWDNDRINGSKSTRSGIGLIEIPGLAEREQQIADKQDLMTREMSQLQRDLMKLSREIDQLQRSILQKESISWEDTNKLQEMLERQISLQEQIEKLKDDNTALNSLQDEINPYNEEIIRKQQELQKLFDELMTDEMKELFEEIQKLMDELDRGKMQEMLKNMQMSNEELINNLDRNLELFKQLEMEKMITDVVTKLKQLAEEQEKLAELTAEEESDINELSNRQEEIAEEFEKLKEELEKIKEKNEELTWKYDMIETEELEESIENSMNESLENLQQNNKASAVPNQKDAAKEMETLSDNLMDMMMQMQNDQLAEDARMLRKLLEDLIDISFDQEDLIEKTVGTNRIDPRFNKLLSEQKRLIVSLKQVEDSLNALAQRQLAIQQFVLREIAQININVEEALKTLEERNISSASSRQQYVMTAVNNLALMLSEALDQMMQQMMSNSMDGDSCPLSGEGQGKPKPSMNSMKNMQQELNRQLEQMKQSMGQPGEDGMPQSGGQTMSEQFARMAAQQEALRRQMQQYLEELRSETGTSDGNAMKAIEEMEETEKDLVHKRLTNETLLRQEQILTRLLESERAEMEREKEERRESKSAQDYPTTDPDSIMELYRRKMMEREMLRTVPPQMNTFYRTKVSQYFIQVQ
ncbi:MAG TPA: hypothetical protein ENN08_00555 [Bacteroidales bacterium]|nr:hypothetical protein [Bacteroidales bacterium]